MRLALRVMAGVRGLAIGTRRRLPEAVRAAAERAARAQYARAAVVADMAAAHSADKAVAVHGSGCRLTKGHGWQ